MQPAVVVVPVPAHEGLTRLTPEQRAKLDRAVEDMAAGRAIVVPLEDAPLFLATLAAITKLHRCEDLSEGELALLRAWEPELTAEDFEADAGVSGEEEMARLGELACGA